MSELFSHQSGAPLALDPDTDPGPVPPELADHVCRTVETDVPFPPELAAAVDAHPETHDFSAPEHDDAVPAAPPMPVEQPLTPLFAGTYAAYDDGKGGAMLVLQPAGGEVVRKHIPAHLIKMAEKFGGGGGGPLGGFLGMFGGN